MPLFPQRAVLPACTIYLAADQTLPNTIFTPVALDTVDSDPLGMADLANHRLVVPPGMAGVWQLAAGIWFTTGVASGDVARGEIMINGVVSANEGRLHAAVATDFFLPLGARPFVLAAGDLITLQGFKTGADSKMSAGKPQTWLSAVRLR